MLLSLGLLQRSADVAKLHAVDLAKLRLVATWPTQGLLLHAADLAKLQLVATWLNQDLLLKAAGLPSLRFLLYNAD